MSPTTSTGSSRRPRPIRSPTEDLVERALASGDAHAIKLTEAALRCYARTDEPVLLLGRGRRLRPGSEAEAPPPGGAPRVTCRPGAGPLATIRRMEYRTLGRTGVKVSPLCLGAMMFGAWGTPDHDESIRIIHRALDAGINSSTRPTSTPSANPRRSSARPWPQAKRRQDRPGHQGARRHGQDPNAQGNSRRWIMAECENSLRRFGTDYIDLYQIHRPSPDTDIDETLGALTDLVRAGKIRYFGSSTFPAHEIVEAQWVAERRAVSASSPSSRRTRFWCAGIEKDVLPTCQKFDMGVLSWSPLAGGWLSGAFGAGKENTSRRSAMLPHHYDMSMPGNQQKLEAVSDLKKVADEAGLA